MIWGSAILERAGAQWLGPRTLHVTRSHCRTADSASPPKVSFRAMNDGRPLGYRKRWAGGALERIRLLRVHGIDLGDLGGASSAPLDDVLDAAAPVWSRPPSLPAKHERPPTRRRSSSNRWRSGTSLGLSRTDPPQFLVVGHLFDFRECHRGDGTLDFLRPVV
jgi:hypothetical protein